MKNVSKSVFLNALVCPSFGWLLRSGKPIHQLSEEALSLAEQFRIEQGVEIGRRARELYLGGTLIDKKGLVAAARNTSMLLADSENSVIFEATFLIDDYVTKADILLRKKKGWHLIEVKSNTNDKPELTDELAYTAMVMMRAGVEISSAALMLISKDYRLGLPDETLFIEVDHTDETLLRALAFAKYWEDVLKHTGATIMPGPELRLECKKCPLFVDCLGKGIDNHILEIPRLSQKKFNGLKNLGIVCIEDIPSTFELTQNQAIVRDCVVLKEPRVNESLENELDAIAWPVYYLDFETVMTAIPLYPDITPYTQMPTQYSIHKCSDVGKVVAHKEFLSGHKKDDRRRLAETLISDLETAGSIITYSNFEQNTINNLARLYPDLSDKLERTLDRIIDLEAIIRKNFYHPDFHGSISIKRVLPVLVTAMSYDDLEISDGDSASATFAYLALGRWKEESEVESIRDNLKHYCARDTLAMVKLHERLHTWE